MSAAAGAFGETLRLHQGAGQRRRTGKILPPLLAQQALELHGCVFGDAIGRGQFHADFASGGKAAFDGLQVGVQALGKPVCHLGHATHRCVQRRQYLAHFG